MPSKDLKKFLDFYFPKKPEGPKPPTVVFPERGFPSPIMSPKKIGDDSGQFKMPTREDILDRAMRLQRDAPPVTFNNRFREAVKGFSGVDAMMPPPQPPMQFQTERENLRDLVDDPPIGNKVDEFLSRFDREALLMDDLAPVAEQQEVKRGEYDFMPIGGLTRRRSR